jgi:hypothetical protein
MRHFVVLVDEENAVLVREIEAGNVEPIGKNDLLRAMGVPSELSEALQATREQMERAQSYRAEAARLRTELTQCEGKLRSFLLADLLSAALIRCPSEEALAEAVKAIELLKLAGKKTDGM